MVETKMKSVSAQYREIATDIAKRIISGEFSVGQRLYGRSLMSSEYSVSPETIRRAFRLLADMKVLEVMPQSGVRVLSVDSAKHYIDGAGERQSGALLNARFRELLREQEKLSRELCDISDAIEKRQDTFFAAKELDYGIGEATVSENSWVIGKSIGALAFWQATRATIIAIRRGQNLIVSPGPFAELYKGDCIVYVAKEADFYRVSDFLCGEDINARKENSRNDQV